MKLKWFRGVIIVAFLSQLSCLPAVKKTTNYRVSNVSVDAIFFTLCREFENINFNSVLKNTDKIKCWDTSLDENNKWSYYMELHNKDYEIIMKYYENKEMAKFSFIETMDNKFSIEGLKLLNILRTILDENMEEK